MFPKSFSFLAFSAFLVVNFGFRVEIKGDTTPFGDLGVLAQLVASEE